MEIMIAVSIVIMVTVTMHDNGDCSGYNDGDSSDYAMRGNAIPMGLIIVVIVATVRVTDVVTMRMVVVMVTMIVVIMHGRYGDCTGYSDGKCGCYSNGDGTGYANGDCIRYNDGGDEDIVNQDDSGGGQNRGNITD
jgi:hypothetical protein